MNTTTAAQAITTAAARIVRETGCTIDAAVDYLFRQMVAERPELLLKVVATA